MQKLSDHTVEKMISYVKEDATISVKMTSEKLLVETDLKLTLLMVYKYLEGKTVVAHSPQSSPAQPDANTPVQGAYHPLPQLIARELFLELCFVIST